MPHVIVSFLYHTKVYTPICLSLLLISSPRVLLQNRQTGQVQCRESLSLRSLRKACSTSCPRTMSTSKSRKRKLRRFRRCLCSPATTILITSEPTTLAPSSTGNAPLTKSARKRLAKQNRTAGATVADKASTAVERVQESIPSAEQVSETISVAAEVTSKKTNEILSQANEVLSQAVDGASKTVNGAAANGSAILAPAVTVMRDQAKNIANVANGAVPDLTGTLSPRSIGSSFVQPQTTPHAPSTNGERKSSFSKPPSTRFAPDLPDDLPEPKGNALPANRKRKTPTDFAPTGSKSEKSRTDSLTPTKAGVKFEDGVAPGEGKEGEKIIVPKANKNVIERTVMTFVMIGGFICESMIRCFRFWTSELTSSLALRRSSIHDCSHSRLSDAGLQRSHRAV